MKLCLNIGFVALILMAICFSRSVSCKTIVEIRFKQFENPSSTLMDRKCCKISYLPYCYFKCQHNFELCIKPFPGTMLSCTNDIRTYVLASGKTTFPEGMQLNSKHKNPWVFIYEKAYVRKYRYFYFLPSCLDITYLFWSTARLNHILNTSPPVTSIQRDCLQLSCTCHSSVL